MSVKPDPSEDEEGNHGPEVPVVETNRFGFILGNGETDSDGPCPELVRHRESKWLNLISQWEQVMEKKSNKVKGQCQKGIPASVRAKCWPLLCGAKDRKEKNTELYKRLSEAPDHQGWTDIIKRDTDRQFPFHEMFQSKDGHGQKDLLEVLKAYTQYRPDEGYCQAQGPVAAVLLMNMPAEEAFWCLVQISELYLPGYYSPLLEGVLFDAAVLSSLLKKLCPAAHKHLHNQGVEPLMFATDWLMCLYSRHLPFNTLLRVWDLFFCYGVRVLFQVAVVLVRRCLGEGRQRKECDGQMETLERLRGVKKHVQNDQADAFIHEVCSVSLSLSDLQKQTEKEMEKWKKERPNSTFDPRGRCHGHRMVWEREQEKQKEHEKKERPKGSLTIPLMRSHSSLSPVLRKKWRKRSSKTDTEEWDGGGRTITRSLMEESDEEEVRRRSVCGIVGEQRAKRDRLTDELCTHKHKDHNTHPKISVVVSSSIDSDVFEKEHTETQGDEKERTAGCVVEESIQTHQQEQDTNQDELSTEAHQDEQNITKDQDDMSTEAPTNQKEHNTDQQTRQDEQTVEITVTLEVCEERTAETSQEEDTETDSSKQEKEIQSDCNIQEEDKQREPCTQQEEETKDRLPQVIMTQDDQQNEENISHVHVVQEELRPETSTDQPEEQKEVDLYIVTSTEEDKETLIDENNEEGFEQELNVLPEEEIKELPAPSEMCEEKDDKKLQEDMSLEQRDNDPHRADKEEIQTTEEVQTVSSLQIKTESDTEHQDGSADLLPESQSSDPHEHDMDAAITAGELEFCPVDSTVEDTVGSGNPEENYVDITEGINTLESQEEEATETSRHSDNSDMDQINPENSEENKPTVCENAICCEVDTTDIKESCNLTHCVVIVDTCTSINLESEKMHFTSESGNPESNVMDSIVGNPESYDVHVTTVSDEHEINVKDGSEKTENNELQIAVGSDNSEHDICNAVENPETNQLRATSGSGNPESSDVYINTVTGSPERCNSETITEHVTTVHCVDESGNTKSNAVDSAVCNQENSNVVFTIGPGNSECSDLPITSESVNSDDNTVDIVDASGNQDFKEVHVTAESEKTQSNEMEIAVGSGSSESDLIEPTVENQESNEVLLTTKSGNPECNEEQVTTESESNAVDLAVGSGNPDCSEIHATPKSDHPETNSGHATNESGNSECNTEDSAAGSGNPHNTECAIESSQETQCSFSIPPSKSPNPNVPPAHLRVRRTSSSRVSYPTILSEDTFREPQQQEHTHTGKTTHTLTEDTNSQPNSPTKSGAPKRLGLFRRLRGETNKTPVPKILIQDFSEKEERLTAKERRRRKREKERKEREEKERKKQEEKDKEKSERKKPQTRGKSFQVLNRKCADNAASPGNSDSQTSRARRNSAPFSDSYF